MAAFVIGCSKDSGEQQHSTVAPQPAADSGTVAPQLDQIRKDFGVIVDVHGHQITVGTPGLETTNTMNQIKDALHKVFGDDFTNYTVVQIVG